MPFANKGSNGQTMLPTTYFRPLKTMDGEVLASNHNMLKLVATLGFIIATSSADPSIKKITKVLQRAIEAAMGQTKPRLC